MSRSVAMRPTLEDAPPSRIVEFRAEAYDWRVAAEHVETIRTSGIDWFGLNGRAGATLVKRNAQRDVWRLTCGRREYFAKLYHPHGPIAQIKLLFRGPTAHREWAVGRYAAAYAIATVVPVAVAWQGWRGRKGPSLLITEAVPAVQPLNEFWLQIRDDRARADALADSLAHLIARAHQCGFQHRDMHPGNILVRPMADACEVLFVDLHNARLAHPVALREAVANLAQLNQWFRRNATRSQRLRFLKCYLACRDRAVLASPYARRWRIEPRQLVEDLAAQADRHANRLWAKRDRRTRRTGRYFARVRPAPGWRGHVLLRNKHPGAAATASGLVYTTDDWQRWLRDPLAWVDPNKHTLMKDSHTATVCKALLPTEPAPVEVIIKRPLPRNLWKRMGQMFGPSRNRRAWRIANMLRNRDLPTAGPLAVIERYAAGFLRTDSISFTECIEGAADLETFLTRDLAGLSPAAQYQAKARLIESLVTLIKAFHARGFVHRDFKATNVLVRWQPPYVGSSDLILIDMDGISHGRRPAQHHRLRVLTRLCVSLLGSPACTRSDRLRFLKRYLTGPGRTSANWKGRWHHLEAMVRGKLRDKQTRRRWKLEHYGRE